MTEADKIVQIANVLGEFTRRMKDRLTLKKNLKKKPWTELSVWDLEELLEHQTDQLYSATSNGLRSGIVHEKAADVANVAMMIADRYSKGDA